MKNNNAMLRGSGAGLAAVIKVDTTVGFLADRRQVVDLSSEPSAYVWKRVFLRRKPRRS